MPDAEESVMRFAKREGCQAISRVNKRLGSYGLAAHAKEEGVPIK